LLLFATGPGDRAVPEAEAQSGIMHHTLREAAQVAQASAERGLIVRFSVLPESGALHVTGNWAAVQELAARVGAAEAVPASLQAVAQAQERLLRPPREASRWRDSMQDTFGMSGMSNTTTMEGCLELTQLVKRADAGDQVLAMVAGPDGKIYMGTNGARLKTFDPVTGAVQDRGTPVPDECFT
jgi:hypothetical protein